jgi:DNA-binding NarL/FixJ family response regulator
MSTRVLVADDQPLVRVGLTKILETRSDFEVVAEAADGAQAVEACTRLRPDVVLMDIRMPSIDGLEATRRIIERNGAATRVLVLTTFGRNEYVYEALRAGASGFLLKDTPPEELLAAVEIVARGDALLAPAITRAVIEEFVRRPPPPKQPPANLEQLTARETEVLHLLARGLANAEIAKQLYISEATVRTHVLHVLQKLNLRDRIHAVIYAYETGLMLPGVQGRDSS